MIPDLLEATQDYMQQLSALEAAYQRDEISIEEVDAKVEELMVDLGRTRREAFSALWASFSNVLQTQWETVAGFTGIGVLTYLWLVIR
ncbi:hypothetical protein [Pseudanabaena sp. FACHB-2040]|uniref:hypothetical protein n=1 Tax=Pseudanabaena sp. FACHB-2040 TaxID=2692859 RepID=UPI001684E625|nr:hypothetical protein [Pseudanabaena sp. FACHB-2040]MBD2256922.1 hypothetical protein [Pseudanabaena sp. FACHB-2040]